PGSKGPKDTRNDVPGRRPSRSKPQGHFRRPASMAVESIDPANGRAARPCSRRGHRRSQAMTSKSPEPAAPGQAPEAAAEPIGFEAAVSELEAIVERMEAGTLSLEESLAAYRRAA